jgi:hypothetical protein
VLEILKPLLANLILILRGCESLLYVTNALHPAMNSFNGKIKNSEAYAPLREVAAVLALRAMHLSAVPPTPDAFIKSHDLSGSPEGDFILLNDRRNMLANWLCSYAIRQCVYCLTTCDAVGTSQGLSKPTEAI